MSTYLIYFNQQWVGEHSAEWFQSRGPLARAVVDDMRSAGVLVFAGGLEEEIDATFSADATSGRLIVADERVSDTAEYLGGMTIIDVPDDQAARSWAGRVAEACGWPQEVRRFKSW
jgi:hypothetical protein